MLLVEIGCDNKPSDSVKNVTYLYGYLKQKIVEFFSTGFKIIAMLIYQNMVRNIVYGAKY